MNPFSLRYYRQESRAVNFEDKVVGNIILSHHDYLLDEYDGYMYKMKDVKLTNIPVLTIQDETWMSLSPMEIESHFMPIKLATGKVGVAGLGLGYYVQRILEKVEVTEVIVYELNPVIIDLYKVSFGDHPKLTIIQQDVLLLHNQEFDFFYCDIYPTVLDKEVVKDMLHITDRNKIKKYHFWAQEYLVKELIVHKYPIPVEWKETYAPFLDFYKRNLNYTSKFPIHLSEKAALHYYNHLKDTLYDDVELEKFYMRF